MYIERHIKKTIDRRFSAFPAVLLTGARQVGKSTLLKEEYPGIRYVSLDNRLAFAAMQEDPPGFLTEQGVPLILDEIQRSGESFTDLKYQIDRNRKNGMYLLSGSQRFRLMRAISESLAGRIGILEMPNLSLREILFDPFDQPFFPDRAYLNQRKSGMNISLPELWEIIHRGGFPELYANRSLDPEDFYASYVDTYLERDVRDLAQVGDLNAFTRFMVAIAARTGSLLNMHDAARDAGVDDKTAKRWLSVLEASGIVFLLPPFYANAAKRLIKTPKVYVCDTGLICYLCRWTSPESLKNGAQAGQIFETFVVTEILKSCYNAGKKPDVYYFRDTNGAEVDLVFFRDNTFFPVEIKKTTTPQTGDTRNFKTLADSFPGYTTAPGAVVCACEEVMTLGREHLMIPVGMI